METTRRPGLPRAVQLANGAKRRAAIEAGASRYIGTCSRHGETEFRTRPTTHAGECQQCGTERDRKYYAANPEKHREATRRSRAKHVEKHRAYSRRWNEANQDYHRQWRAENPEKVVEATRRWQAKNPDKLVATAARRRARKRNAAPPDACPIKIRAFYLEAEQLTKANGTPYHVDHLYPLSKGGAHHQDNLVTMLAEMNLSKGDAIWWTPEQIAAGEYEEPGFHRPPTYWPTDEEITRAFDEAAEQEEQDQ